MKRSRQAESVAFKDAQLDLFAGVVQATREPALPVIPAPAVQFGLINHGPWPGLSSWSWMHAFALRRHEDGRVQYATSEGYRVLLSGKRRIHEKGS